MSKIYNIDKNNILILIGLLLLIISLYLYIVNKQKIKKCEK